MAFPNKNYTETPNALFDDHLPSLTEAELKILLVVCRYTWGYHKDEVLLTRQDFADRTGLSIRSITDGLAGLVTKDLIWRYEESGKGSVYVLAVNGQSVPGQILPPQGEQNPARVQGKFCPPLLITKENLKESISPTPLTADADEPLIDFLHNLARAHGRPKPHFSAKERHWLFENDSAEMRHAIAEAVADPGVPANIGLTVMTAAGWTGRPAYRKPPVKIAVPMARQSGWVGPPYRQREPERERQPSQPERTSARVAKRLGITE